MSCRLVMRGLLRLRWLFAAMLLYDLMALGASLYGTDLSVWPDAEGMMLLLFSGEPDNASGSRLIVPVTWAAGETLLFLASSSLIDELASERSLQFALRCRTAGRWWVAEYSAVLLVALTRTLVGLVACLVLSTVGSSDGSGAVLSGVYGASAPSLTSSDVLWLVALSTLTHMLLCGLIALLSLLIGAVWSLAAVGGGGGGVGG